MTDREQIRRDAARAQQGYTNYGYSCAGHCLALLAELEQAERERDKARDERDGARCDRDNFRASAQENARLRDLAEARLAKVPALVEALRNWLEDVDEAQREDLRLDALQYKLGAMFLGYGGGHNHEDDLRAALADWEQA